MVASCLKPMVVFRILGLLISHTKTCIINCLIESIKNMPEGTNIAKAVAAQQHTIY